MALTDQRELLVVFNLFQTLQALITLFVLLCPQRDHTVHIPGDIKHYKWQDRGHQRIDEPVVPRRVAHSAPPH